MEDIVSKIMREMGAKGGRVAASHMTKAQRVARAKKAAAASGKARAKKASVKAKAKKGV